MTCHGSTHDSPDVEQSSRVTTNVGRSVIVLLALAVFVGSASGGSRATIPETSSAAGAQSTDWKSRPIHWTDIQTLTAGGRLVYRATNIRLGADRFAITASVTNLSPNRISIRTYTGVDAPGTVRLLSFGLAYREAASPGLSTRRLINVRAASFAPRLPSFLDPGQTWKGIFSGQSPRLRQHHDWWIVYGLFQPGGYWLSDNSFST